MRRGYGALQRRLLAILNAEDRVFETYTLVADAFEVKADEDGLRLITTAQMSAARRALRGLVRDGAVIDLGRHYPNTRRHWCSKRTELLHEIQYKREAIEALIRRGQVDEVARLSQQMGPLFERAREVGIEPHAEAMEPKKSKVSAASKGDPARDECVEATAAPAAAPTATSTAGVQATQTGCVNFC